MKHKVSEIEGALLDAAVAKALNQPFHFIALGEYPFDLPQHHRRVFFRVDGDHICVGQMGLGGPGDYAPDWQPSADWSIAGPIIERERIPNDGDLVAAMRAYVASKFGDEVELP